MITHKYVVGRLSVITFPPRLLITRKNVKKDELAEIIAAVEI